MDSNRFAEECERMKKKKKKKRFNQITAALYLEGRNIDRIFLKLIDILRGEIESWFSHRHDEKWKPRSRESVRCGQPYRTVSNRFRATL